MKHVACSPQHDIHISQKVIKMAAPKECRSARTSLTVHKHLNRSSFWLLLCTVWIENPSPRPWTLALSSWESLCKKYPCKSLALSCWTEREKKCMGGGGLVMDDDNIYCLYQQPATLPGIGIYVPVCLWVCMCLRVLLETACKYCSCWKWKRQRVFLQPGAAKGQYWQWRNTEK